MNPFAKPRVPAKRKEPRRTAPDRVRLQNAQKMKALRMEVYQRSGGKCEAEEHAPDCPGYAGWDEGHLAHKKHASRKSDTASECLWKTPQCHRWEHNGGKPCKRRPGRTMTKTEGQRYWFGSRCFCEGAKRKQTAFCDSCRGKLGPQAQMDLDELKGQDWLKAVADAELELMALESL